MKELDINAGLDKSGFTLNKILSKLVVKELFAELKLTDIPAWNPFSSPFTLGLTALQIVVQDAYSVADRKVSCYKDWYIRPNRRHLDCRAAARRRSYFGWHRHKPPIPVYCPVCPSTVPLVRTRTSSRNPGQPVCRPAP